MTPLELADTDTLMNELANRFDAVVFHGIKNRPIDVEDRGMKVFCIRTGGDPHQCIGLAYGIMSYCQANLDRGIEELSPGSL